MKLLQNAKEYFSCRLHFTENMGFDSRVCIDYKKKVSFQAWSSSMNSIRSTTVPKVQSMSVFWPNLSSTTAGNFFFFINCDKFCNLLNRSYRVSLDLSRIFHRFDFRNPQNQVRIVCFGNYVPKSKELAEWLDAEVRKFFQDKNRSNKK